MLLAALGLGCCPGAAFADIAQISKLSDVIFTNLDPNLSASSSQNVCVFSSALTTLYTVTASGSGAGSAFALQAGGSIPDLPYSVMWSASPGQTTGTSLSAGIPSANQTSGAISLLCLVGLSASASLTVTLAPSDLQSAVSGVTYSGLLTLSVTAQ